MRSIGLELEFVNYLAACNIFMKDFGMLYRSMMDIWMTTVEVSRTFWPSHKSYFKNLSAVVSLQFKNLISRDACELRFEILTIFL